MPDRLHNVRSFPDGLHTESTIVSYTTTENEE